MKSLLSLSVALALSVPIQNVAFAADKAGKPAQEEAQIAWFHGDVDAAFAYAKQHNKPLFLYWGAVWCPPCNQVKATVFNRQSFIDRSKFFVPVHIDGDSPGAQKLGERFKVRGYPTTILFRPDGTEITRLPGEVDAQRYVQVLESGMNAGRPIKETLAAALNGSKDLTANDWRLLSYYSWDTDEQQLLPASELVTTLTKLAANAPKGESATRLQLTAISARAGNGGALMKGENAESVQFLSALLSDPKSVHDNMDILTNVSADIVANVSAPDSDARKPLVTKWIDAARKLYADKSLSKADRVQAVAAEVALAQLERKGPLDDALIKEVKMAATQADKDTTNAYERQSVINNVAHLLSDAGLLDDSDTLLKAEIKRSHSPYYFMSSLGANAKHRGNNNEALDWYQKAYDASKGPATRLQWGSAYLSNLLELSPNNEDRIASAAHSVISELSQTENAFYERNRATLEKLGKKFGQWNTLGQHQASYQKIFSEMNEICAKLPSNDAQQAVCKNVLPVPQA